MGSPAGVASSDVGLLEVGEAGAESMNQIRHRSETETRGFLTNYFFML
jgi:hypothetical protein